ncbi:MAG: sugar nucleotide-binding protein, partial [Ruminococcaceae bacterium]|nr:sugar nucleotide-binding protein [Oscillospiraceae bacterium]
PDAVEQNPERAYNINVTILGEILDGLKNVGCLFYPSTDSVYGDSENGYHFKEGDPLSAVNTYGKQKAAADRVVTAHGYNVLRFPFLASPSLLPHKKHFYDVIAESLINQKPFELFCDSLRTSLDFNTAAALTVRLMREYSDTLPKIMNLSGDDDLSKYDVGVMIAEKIGADKKYAVPLSLSDGGEIFKTARAKSTLMDNSLVKRVLGLNEIKIKL